MAWNPGQDVFDGHYVIEQQLGEGGFGITYLARTPRGDLKVIKTLRDRILNNPTWDSSYLERFRQALHQEAAILFQCRHPNIVRVENHFDEDNLPCIVMEYIQGGTLRERMHQQGSLSEAEALQYIQQVGEALALVHTQGLLHRDIKPHNIMLRTGTSEAVLIDFGIAREFTENMTQAHTALVTPGYAPLEQYYDKAKRGEFTDVYALAATLYALLTGGSPVSALDRQGEIHEQRPDPLQPPTQVNPKVSARVSEAVMWAMALDYKQRPQSVRQWLARLLGDSSVPTTLPPEMSETAALPPLNNSFSVLAANPQVSETAVPPSPQPVFPISKSWRCIRTITNYSNSDEYRNSVERVAVSLNGKLLAGMLANDGGDRFAEWVNLWNVATGAELHTLSDDWIMDFSQDSRTLVGRNYFWDVATGKTSGRIAENIDSHWNIGISPGFRTLMSYQRGDNPDAPTKLWDRKTGDEIGTFPALKTPFEPVHHYRLTQYSPDGRFLAKVIGDYRLLVVWDLYRGELLCRISGGIGGCIGNLAFSPDSQIVASAWETVEGFGSLYTTEYVDITILPTPSGNQIWDALSATFGSRYIEPTASYRRRRYLASTRYSVGKTWIILLSDVITGQELCRIKVGSKFFDSFIHSLTFSPDGRILACSHGRGNITLWQISPGWLFPLAAKKLCSLTTEDNVEVKSLAFHSGPDRQVLVVSQ